MVYPRGELAAAGFWTVEDSGKSPVTFTGFSIRKAHGLRVTKAWLVPIAHADGEYLLIGDGGRWPPHDGSVAKGQWAQRVPLVGGVLKPGQERNLVFGAAWTAGRYGITAGPALSYRSGGRAYTVNEQAGLAVAGNCNKVPG
jgi:hypothetical protein